MLIATLAALLLQATGLSGGETGGRGPPATPGNSSCAGPEPYLIFSRRQAVFQVSAHGGGQRRVLRGAGTPVLLDFHYTEGRLYWLNVQTGIIQRAFLNGTHRQRVYAAGAGTAGFAVDWIQNQVIWTSREKGTIQAVHPNGENLRTLFANLSHPSSIVVDPNEKVLFWVCDGTGPSIQKSNLQTGGTTRILKTTAKLGVLSLDFSDRRLFWVQSGSEGGAAIGSCDYDGNNVSILHPPAQSRPWGMSVFLGHVYYSDIQARTIVRINKYTGVEAVDIIPRHRMKSPVSIRVVHPLTQPVAEAPPTMLKDGGCDLLDGDCVSMCSSHIETGVCQCRDGFTLSKHGSYCEDVNECALWNHGCTLGCENIPGSFLCTCPRGFALIPDLKTCRELVPCAGKLSRCEHGCIHTEDGDTCACPHGSLLQPDGISCSGCSLPDNGGCSQLCVPLGPGHWGCDCRPGYHLHPDGKHCLATGPQPYVIFANTIDIRRVNWDGTGDQSVLSEPQGTIIGVDYDPVQSKMYFVNTVLRHIERAHLDGSGREVVMDDSLPSPQGLAVDWINQKLYWTDQGLATIERSDLNGLNRESIVRQAIDRPGGIVVHPGRKKLFWTDMGKKPAVDSASLDGSDRLLVASSGLVAPNGVTVDYAEDRLYWCDSKTGLIEEADLDGSNRRVLAENQVGRPFDIAVFEDLLWVTEWEPYLVLKLNKRTGRILERVHGDVVRPASLVVVHPLAKPGADVCLHDNGGCDQLCESRFGLAHCSCQSHFTESAVDGTCLPANASEETSEHAASDSRHSDTLSSAVLKLDTPNDEVTPTTVSGFSSTVKDTEAVLATEKMVADQRECSSTRCHAQARCLLMDTGTAACHCLRGFSGDGQQCVDVDECALGTHSCDAHADCLNVIGWYLCRCMAGYSGTGFTCQAEFSVPAPWVTTRMPAEVTTQMQSIGTVQSCPESHDAYCLNGGICFYLTEIQSYACNCVSGYTGERCQFSDLDWWELHQMEQENLTMVTCILLTVTLLSISACAAYCHGSRQVTKNHTCTNSETREEEKNTSRSSDCTSQQCDVMLEPSTGGEGREAPCISRCHRSSLCSSETGDSLALQDTGVNVPLSASSTQTKAPGVHLKSVENLIFLDEPCIRG